MKKHLWAPLLAISAAILVLVPTTLAVAEPGTTLSAQLGFNRFPSGFAAVESQLHFLTDGSARLDVRVIGGTGRRFAIRVYADGSCTSPGRWIINRVPGAGPNGPFIEVMGNTTTQFPVHPLDLQRLREEVSDNPNEAFALAVAVVNPVTNRNYRACTSFVTAPFPPIVTTTSTTTTASSATSTSSRRTTTSFSTRTSLSTRTSFLTTVSLSTGTSLTTGTTTSTGVTPVSTVTAITTQTGITTVEFTGRSSYTTTADATVTSRSTVVSTFTTTIAFTTGTTFTTATTRTTGTTTITTGTTITTASTITL